MLLNISKKKKDEFNNIFKLVNINDIVLDIDLCRKIIDSDFYEHFINHTKNKIETIVQDNNIFYLHIDISSFSISDLYYYDKILIFAQMIHIFTDKLLEIYIYGSSYIFTNLTHMINNSLNFDISKKLIFENKQKFNDKFNKMSIFDNN